MATVDLPDSVERQLLLLDRQVRDATFGRGISRVGLFTPLLVGTCFAADWYLGLNGGVRLIMLVVCVVAAAIATWSCVLRPIWRPPSLAELAALVERQHPELKERLTSLVELRDHDAAGASPLMRDLLARQTARALDKLDVLDAAPAIRSPGTALLAVVACLLLFAPFAIRPAEYGLLWSRLFAPWGNFHWGANELVVVGGDRVVAKGSNVPVQIELRQHSKRNPLSPDQTIVWLHWTDTAGVRDSRRLEWDADSQRFATTLPHVVKGLKFHAATSDARSEIHCIDVANPPVIARLQLDIEPPAYTGLPARALDGAQGEIRAAERSRIVMKLEFTEPVTSVDLVWPIVPETVADGDKPVTERTMPARLSDDKRSATVEALAVSSGAFAFHIKNGFGLTNDDPPRSLVVDPDLPPAISLDGDEEAVSVRPNDRHLIAVQIQDDYGLTVVELHLESSVGKKRIDPVPVDVMRNRSFKHEFPVDIADFELNPGQAITYRVRAVDNRPIPGPQESWTKPRTLMIQTRSQLPPDKELAKQDQNLKHEISDLREALAETREALEQLHRRTEDESLRQKNSDKSAELEKLQQQQAELSERLQKLAAELAERQLTRKLSERAQQLADRDLAEAQQRLEVAKQGEPRDQLQPISEAIDRLASVDRQLDALDQQLSELNRLEHDLAQLEQLARNTDRLAEKLDKLEDQARDAAENLVKANQPDSVPANQPGDPVASDSKPKPGEQPAEPTGKPSDQPARAANNAAAQADKLAAIEADRRSLETESQKLNDDFEQLLKKHPELLDAARRDQLQRLEKLADQAAQLAQPQEQLAKAFERAADNPSENEKKDVPPKPVGAPETLDDENPSGKVPAEQLTPAAAAGAEAVKEQRQIAQEATRQAQDLAQREGPESKATQSALQFAKQAVDAARQAEIGNLDEAAQQGQAAAQVAKETANELAPVGQPGTPQSERADQLADRQAKLAEELQQMSGNKAAQQGARQQGQEQLAEAAATLSQRLKQAANNLESAPLDSKSGADAAQQAQQAVDQAQQAMKQAVDSSKANDTGGAGEQAAVATEKLQEAAKQAQQAPDPPQAGQSVPEELGTSVAQAAQQLRKAQEQLESYSQPKAPSSPEGQPPQGQPGQGQPGQDPSEQGEFGQSAEQYRQAAAAMRRVIQATQGEGPGKPGNDPEQTGSKSRGQGQAKASQQPGGLGDNVPGELGKSNEQAQPGDEQGQPGQPGGVAAGGGTQDDALSKLDADLKKQGQRNWGRLPGQLRTEILQGASKKPRPEYAKQIKSYFEEIAKPATREKNP